MTDDVAAVADAIDAAVASQGDLRQAVAAIRRLPGDLPARAAIARGLVGTIVRTGSMQHLAWMREIDGLVEIAGDDGSPDWRRTRTIASVMALMAGVLDGRSGDVMAASARLEVLARDADGDPMAELMIGQARSSFQMLRAMQDGDPAAIGRYVTQMRQMGEQVPSDPRFAPLREQLAGMADVADGLGRGAGLDELKPVVDALPHWELDQASSEAIAMMAELRAMQSSDGQVSEEQLRRLQEAAGAAGGGGLGPAFHNLHAGMAALGLGEETDPGRVDAGVEHLREALAAADDTHRSFALLSLALGLWRRFEVTARTADLREARGHLEEAALLAGGPHHENWQMINGMLTDIARILGERTDFHRPALDGLRGRVWRVLAEQNPTAVTAAVRGAGEEAIDVARTCLFARDPGAAVTALDEGRGLALYASTATGTIADRLTAVGAPALARRWRAAAAADPPQLSADLRRDVLAALTEVGGDLLDPPSLVEIAHALRAVDADALVYLIPGTAHGSGFAVRVTAAGEASFMTLPNLAGSSYPEIERYLAVLARRGAVAARGREPTAGLRAPAAEEAELRACLVELSRWAWGAAMGPLIELWLSGPRADTDRPARVVLAPMGDLARVPWHAARKGDGPYAVELVAISQTASARMLCHSAALPAVPLTSTGLVVGDPDTADPDRADDDKAGAAELRSARREAFGIRQSFYSGARYVGRRPDGSTSPSGPGTVAQVRDWLVDTGPSAGAMLHLACHGVVEDDTDEPSAYLLLAGGERMRADELVPLMLREPGRAIALVVLSACRSGVSLNGYDEAYSLATAFLAAGARSVLSTQWNVDDRASSALMYMAHHYMRVEGAPPWEALRRAQLWALTPDRELPDTMPRQLCPPARSAALGDVIRWAGYVHWGR